MGSDAVILSDIHLGSEVSRAAELHAFLKLVREGEGPTERLIVNGDLVEDLNFHRFGHLHWKVLSDLRKLSEQTEVVWLAGNHDCSASTLSHVLGVPVLDEYQFESGGKKILVLHGDAFDKFLVEHPFLTWVGDKLYWLIQKVDPSHEFARWAKKNSKTFLRVQEAVKEKAVAYARERGADVVCCGHTHHACGPEEKDESPFYFNSGCWTENPPTYLEVKEGEVRVCHWSQDLALVKDLLRKIRDLASDPADDGLEAKALCDRVEPLWHRLSEAHKAEARKFADWLEGGG